MNVDFMNDNLRNINVVVPFQNQFVKQINMLVSVFKATPVYAKCKHIIPPGMEKVTVCLLNSEK